MLPFHRVQVSAGQFGPTNFSDAIARVERPHGGYRTAGDHAGVGGSEGDPRHSN